MVEYYLKITDSLGCPRLTLVPELFVSPASREKADALLNRHGIDKDHRVVVMVPGAAYGSSKCWQPASFGRVADHLIDRHSCKVLIIPGPQEGSIAREIQSTMRNTAILLADPVVPLDILMAIIQSSALVISNDTGPRHFAVAFDRPVVVIMGPTDPRYTQLDFDKAIILRENIDCSPCQLKVCPRDHRCMAAITPDRVIEASEYLISRHGVLSSSPGRRL
jgi:heptosyltransferase-2